MKPKLRRGQHVRCASRLYADMVGERSVPAGSVGRVLDLTQQCTPAGTHECFVATVRFDGPQAGEWLDCRVNELALEVV